MKAPDKIYVEVCEDGIFAFPEPPFAESVEYIRADINKQPVEGLDVTDFCKPIDPGIAQCVADHWWEMIGEESTNKQPAEGLEEEMEKFFETMPVLEHENIFEDTFQNIARHFAEWGAKSIKSMIQDRYDENCRCAEKIKSFGIRACEDNDILSLIEQKYE